MSDTVQAVCGELVTFREVSFRVLQGERRIPHRATDFYAVEGSHVHAPVAGEVMPQIPRNDAGGNHVRLRGEDGRTRYFAHLRDAPLVSPGATVAAGELLGFVGHSGRTRVDHLHYSRRTPDGRDFENVFFDQIVLASAAGGPNASGHPQIEWIGPVGCPLEGGAILRPERPSIPSELAELMRPELAEAVHRPGAVRRLPDGGAELDLGALGRVVLTLAAARYLGVG